MIDEETGATSMQSGSDAGLGERVLLVIDGAALQVIPLPTAGALSIGRSNKCGVVIDSGSVSRHHADLLISQSNVEIEDVGSSNGTLVNGTRIAVNARTDLQIGVPFLVGGVTLMVQTRTANKRPTTETGTKIGALEQSAARIAVGTLPVLVVGETGVGKERFAERLHEMSPRRSASFVRVNCSAISEPLLEVELFGNDQAGRPGMLEAADGGTAFLNDIDQLPPNLQQKLLRAMEDGSVRRLNAAKPRAIDVRFIFSTSKDLAAEVEAGRFRRDLYFRLAGAVFTIPPLRERTDEIIPLAEQFLASAGGPLGRTFVLAEESKQWLTDHHWPGNIRELRNACERAVLLATGSTVELHHLTITADEVGKRSTSRGRAPTIPPPLGFLTRPSASDMPSQVRATVAELEKQRILEALEKCAGNQTRAAEMLGISRRTLINRLDEYGIARPRKRDE